MPSGPKAEKLIDFSLIPSTKARTDALVTPEPSVAIERHRH
jgi:hypothetical protein